MSLARGFPPIARPGARILILGSMPGRESLARQQYYAHPRNAFWPIVNDLLQIEASDYRQRTRQLAARGVALWDVLKACFRIGSLDSAIDENRIVSNDFDAFFAEHPRIGHLFFNGAKAEALYVKHVRPKLPTQWAVLPATRLPSTSPAHASMSRADKTAAWRAILQTGLQ
ncbi:MAG: DNA-deoxyinosine glycosylase [Xanthomonadales bacterium]|nr:DNA-deoxyinosine glycosylase [Xanthomonadales bacterium]